MEIKNGDEISLRELLIKSKAARRYILGKWRQVLLGAVIFAGLGLGYSFYKKAAFVGSLTFIVQESSGSGLGAYAGLASQFGIELGGLSGSSGVFSGDNVMEFLKSRLMTEKVLLSDTVWQEKKITLGDMYIRMYHLDEKWKEEPGLAGFSFPLNTDPTSLTRLQDSVMMVLYTRIIKSNLTVAKPDKKLDFIAVKTVSPNEYFSKLYTERLVDMASRFYIETRTQRTQTSVNKLQAESDSILLALNKVTFEAAKSQDININPVKHTATVDLEFATRDKNLLAIMYEEVKKNLEMSKMELYQETPIIQVVDSPRFPLKVDKIGHLLGCIGGGVVGIFLTVIFIGLRKFLQDLMK